MSSGSLRVLDWLAGQSVATVDFPDAAPANPFFNINTPADLTAAEAAIANFGLRPLK
jgi:molybdopterin-guanine dinucleotide biosynthesis protein A